MKQADEKDRMDLAQKAVTAYLGAIALNPYDDGLLVRLGLTYDEMGRFDEAYIAYSKRSRGGLTTGFITPTSASISGGAGE